MTPPLPHPKRWFASRWLWLGLAVAALAVLFTLNPTDYVWMPKCPFKLLTGWQCPGCGFQRAVHALLHGHPVEAWRYNRFLILAVPWLIVVAFTEYVLKGERQARWRRIFEGPWPIGLYAVAFVIWGVARNILGI